MEKEGQRNWGGVRKVGRQRTSSTATVCNIYFCLFSLFIRLWQEKRKITFESSLRQFLVLLTIRHRWKITPNVHRRKTRGERKGKTWRLRWGTQKKKKHVYQDVSLSQIINQIQQSKVLLDFSAICLRGECIPAHYRSSRFESVSSWMWKIRSRAKKKKNNNRINVYVCRALPFTPFR